MLQNNPLGAILLPCHTPTPRDDFVTSQCLNRGPYDTVILSCVVFFPQMFISKISVFTARSICYFSIKCCTNKYLNSSNEWQHEHSLVTNQSYAAEVSSIEFNGTFSQVNIGLQLKAFFSFIEERKWNRPGSLFAWYLSKDFHSFFEYARDVADQAPFLVQACFTVELIEKTLNCDTTLAIELRFPIKTPEKKK